LPPVLGLRGRRLVACPVGGRVVVGAAACNAIAMELWEGDVWVRGDDGAIIATGRRDSTPFCELRANRDTETSAGLTETSAWLACHAYGEATFRYGWDPHSVLGIITHEIVNDHWFFKLEADVTNQYGAEAPGWWSAQLAVPRKALSLICSSSTDSGARSLSSVWIAPCDRSKLPSGSVENVHKLGDVHRRRSWLHVDACHVERVSECLRDDVPGIRNRRARSPCSFGVFLFPAYRRGNTSRRTSPHRPA